MVVVVISATFDGKLTQLMSLMIDIVQDGSIEDVLIQSGFVEILIFRKDLTKVSIIQCSRGNRPVGFPTSGRTYLASVDLPAPKQKYDTVAFAVQTFVLTRTASDDDQ